MPSQPRPGYKALILWMPAEVKEALRAEAEWQTDLIGRRVSMSELANETLAARFTGASPLDH